jgi:uncharacterized RDD family membrane protein YckC
MHWHYVEEGQQVGPVNDDRLLELERSGKINADTLVWREGMADWKSFLLVRSELKPSGVASGIDGGGKAEAASEPASELGKSPEAVCGECGKIFPIDEMIRHGSTRICPGCKPVFMQKLSEGANINVGEMRYAPVLTRFCAVFLDGLILGALNIGLGLIAGFSLAQAAGTQPRGTIAVQMIVFVIQFSIGITYETVMIGKFGATLGKMACKIKVVTADGGRVTYMRALGRYFAKLLSAFTCLIGYIIAFFDSERRALHDRICNTRVIRN